MDEMISLNVSGDDYDDECPYCGSPLCGGTCQDRDDEDDEDDEDVDEYYYDTGDHYDSGVDVDEDEEDYE